MPVPTPPQLKAVERHCFIIRQLPRLKAFLRKVARSTKTRSCGIDGNHFDHIERSLSQRYREEQAVVNRHRLALLSLSSEKRQIEKDYGYLLETALLAQNRSDTTR